MASLWIARRECGGVAAQWGAATVSQALLAHHVGVVPSPWLNATCTQRWLRRFVGLGSLFQASFYLSFSFFVSQMNLWLCLGWSQESTGNSSFGRVSLRSECLYSSLRNFFLIPQEYSLPAPHLVEQHWRTFSAVICIWDDLDSFQSWPLLPQVEERFEAYPYFYSKVIKFLIKQCTSWSTI